MSKRKMTYLILGAIALTAVWFGWKLTSRSAYESAAYKALETYGEFEIREYPDVMMATTTAKFESQGNDGSFGRLFKYITGANEDGSEISMTTPVFMEPESDELEGQMGFVLPAKIASNSIPDPTNSSVQIKKRTGGKFAVLRFSGRMNEQTKTSGEEKLREWIADKKLTGAEVTEFAGYDPPWTPGLLRRNEVLIRLID